MPWTRIVLTGSLLILTSCAGRSSVVPPVTLAPKASESATFNGWMQGVINAYQDNCITLKVIRREDPRICRALVE